jgi:hypothetical protein
MARTKKGNAAELGTMALYHADGWVVALRRHWPGPGDILAVRGLESHLIEVKGTLHKFDNFGPKKRAEARAATAQHEGMVAVYAWWPPLFAEHVLIYEDDWPT